MDKNVQIRILETILKHNISQLIKKYGNDLVFEIWEETKTSGQPYFCASAWKSKMTLNEALEYLDDYCVFIEALIRKHLGAEKRVIPYPPALFN